MSQRDHILKTLRKACGGRRIPSRTQLRDVVERLYISAYVWQLQGYVVSPDRLNNMFETSTAVSVLFRLNSVLITFPQCIAEHLPIDKGGCDDHAVQLRYMLHGNRMLGSKLVVTDLRLCEIVLETAAHETHSLLHFIQNI